ncbi:MAG TPA: hypothetical protein VN814_18780 [Caulobacteraceae bacterium]|nr:hypothetical protein [Caulobacteraceae bacterium]
MSQAQRGHQPLSASAMCQLVETARVFSAAAPGDWAEAMAELDRALSELPAARP